MIRETGELIFTTSLGATRTVRVPDPFAFISQEMLNTAEAGIRSADPFDATVGNLIALKRAERVNVGTLVLIAPTAA